LSCRTYRVAKLGVQLAHADRKPLAPGLCGWEFVLARQLRLVTAGSFPAR
jgi:hypothetical protein